MLNGVFFGISITSELKKGESQEKKCNVRTMITVERIRILKMNTHQVPLRQSDKEV